MSIAIPQYIAETIREKLSEVVCKVENMLPEEMQEAFVSTRLSHGSLNYADVWLFSQSLIVQIREPLSKKVQFEVGRFKEAVDWVRLTARGYDFETDAADNAELELEFTTADSFTGAISASGKGCSELLRLYRRRFLRNWIEELARNGNESREPSRQQGNGGTDAR